MRKGFAHEQSTEKSAEYLKKINIAETKIQNPSTVQIEDDEVKECRSKQHTSTEIGMFEIEGGCEMRWEKMCNG